VDTTLYYTFSTIAQALAGAVAFLGAFVLFRLQSIAHQLRLSADLLSQTWLGDDELQRASAVGDFGAFVDRAEHLYRQPIPSGWKPKHQAALVAMRSSWTKRGQILARLKNALLFNGVVMALAVAVVASVTRLTEPLWLAAAVLVVGVAAFVGSLLAIGSLVWSVSRDA
jgi:hypothetical protein